MKTKTFYAGDADSLWMCDCELYLAGRQIARDIAIRFITMINYKESLETTEKLAGKTARLVEQLSTLDRIVREWGLFHYFDKGYAGELDGNKWVCGEMHDWLAEQLDNRCYINMSVAFIKPSKLAEQYPVLIDVRNIIFDTAINSIADLYSYKLQLAKLTLKYRALDREQIGRAIQQISRYRATPVLSISPTRKLE